MLNRNKKSKQNTTDTPQIGPCNHYNAKCRPFITLNNHYFFNTIPKLKFILPWRQLKSVSFYKTHSGCIRNHSRIPVSTSSLTVQLVTSQRLIPVCSAWSMTYRTSAQHFLSETLFFGGGGAKERFKPLPRCNKKHINVLGWRGEDCVQKISIPQR